MGGSRRHYSREFKLEAVRLVVEQGRAQVPAHRLGTVQQYNRPHDSALDEARAARGPGGRAGRRGPRSTGLARPPRPRNRPHHKAMRLQPHPAHRTLLALATLVGLPLLGAQDAAPAEPPSAELGAAIAKVRAQDYAGAIPELERLARADAESGRAWYWLGYARHGLGEYEAALEAHLEAAEFEPVRAMASYNAGCAHARLGNRDEAFEWLTRARAAGFANLALLSSDADLARLRSDPRFASLFPVGEEAAFVEDVRVLLALEGEAAGDRFGWIGRNAGDTDGDGVDDLLISAPFKAVDGAVSAGRIYVFSGRTGELRWKVDGTPGAQLGIGIECAGDVNRDGIPDQIAGANQAAGGRGAAYVFSGEDGELLVELTGERRGDHFGRKVAGAGDQDGDGFDDLIVGAPNHAPEALSNGANAGRAYVFSGRTGEVIFQLDGEHAGDNFGRSVDAWSKDGEQLVIVGAANAGETRSGRVYVFRVEGGAPREAFRIESKPGDQNLGLMFVSAVGDVNGDGVVDVYGSDWSSNANGIQGAGRVYVHSGADGAMLHELAGDARGIGFGIGTAEAGDVDGDGHDDLLIGAWQDGAGAPGAGSATLFSGRTGAVLAKYTCATPGDTFGFDTTGLGDVDGDGAPDFLITAADSFVRGRQSGRVLVVAGPRFDGVEPPRGGGSEPPR